MRGGSTARFGQQKPDIGKNRLVPQHYISEICNNVTFPSILTLAPSFIDENGHFFYENDL